MDTRKRKNQKHPVRTFDYVTKDSQLPVEEYIGIIVPTNIEQGGFEALKIYLSMHQENYDAMISNTVVVHNDPQQLMIELKDKVQANYCYDKGYDFHIIAIDKSITERVYDKENPKRRLYRAIQTLSEEKYRVSIIFCKVSLPTFLGRVDTVAVNPRPIEWTYACLPQIEDDDSLEEFCRSM